MGLEKSIDLGGQSPAFRSTLTNQRLTHESLNRSRPTAVNLADGAERLRAVAKAAAAAGGATPSSVVEAVVAAAEAYFEEDVRANRVRC